MSSPLWRVSPKQLLFKYTSDSVNDRRLDSSTTPFIGRNGITLSEAWDPDPIAYVGVNPPHMPNMFCMFGPNSSPFAGSIVHTFEACAHYIIKCVKKLQQEYLKSMVCKYELP